MGKWHEWVREKGHTRVLLGKPRGKRIFGRPRHRWEYKYYYQSLRSGAGRHVLHSWTGGGQLGME